jgi:hypothetical protein
VIKVAGTKSGFTVLEMLIATGLIGVFIYYSMTMFQSLNFSVVRSRTTSTRDRLLSGIRNVAGMPATLRASARATDSAGTLVNQALYNCVGSSTPSQCENNKTSPLTLYAPTVVMDASGNPVGLKAISAPDNAPNTKLHLDLFGVSCDIPSASCPFTIYTSFRAQCPPNPLPAAPAPKTDPAYMTYFDPLPFCTVADVIEVLFTVQVDKDLVAGNPELLPYIMPFSGSISVRGSLVFGNEPQ